MNLWAPSSAFASSRGEGVDQAKKKIWDTLGRILEIQMSDDGTIIPITDEQAKLGQEIVKALSGVGSFLAEALASTPRDLIGYLGGDWLRFRRAENIAKMMNRTRERLEAWGVKDPEPASLSLALPILRGAADESRETIRDLWGRLMAATLDPSRAGKVRQGFCEVIMKIDPVDAVVLNYFKTSGVVEMYDHDNRKQKVAARLSITEDELEASIWNLEKLGLLKSYASSTHATAFGREFLRVVDDSF